jgi:hypothetical protein
VTETNRGATGARVAMADHSDSTAFGLRGGKNSKLMPMSAPGAGTGCNTVDAVMAAVPPTESM